MGDEEVAQAVLALQVAEQAQDLVLHEHVERRDRLVAHDDLGGEGERAGDRDALTLAARELGRVPPQHRCGQGDVVHQLPHARRALLRRAALVEIEGLLMIRSIVNMGFSDEYGSWKIGCTRWRNDLQLLALEAGMSWPSNRMRPLVGSITFSSMRAVVVLPEPDSPTIATVSPRGTANDTLLTATKSSFCAADVEDLGEVLVLDDVVRRGGGRRFDGARLATTAGGCGGTLAGGGCRGIRRVSIELGAGGTPPGAGARRPPTGRPCTSACV